MTTTPDSVTAERVDLDVLDVMRDLIAVVDREYRYLAANRAHLAAHGMTLDEIRGRSVAEVMGAQVFERELRHHYDRALVGEIESLEGWFELRAIGRRYCAVTYKPIRDQAGVVSGIAIIVRDQTEHQEVMQSLQISQERLNLALAAARAGIWEWDVVTNELSWSEQALQLFGVRREEFGGTYEAFLDFLYAEDRPTVEREVSKALVDVEAGSRYSVEYRMVQPKGRIRWHLAQGQVLRDEQGQPFRMIGVVTDVSAVKDLEEQLQRAQKLEAVGRLAGGVAHDFNNILTGLMGEAFLAIEDDVSENVRRSLESIVQGCERAASLTQRLLTFARQKQAEVLPVDVNAVLASMDILLHWTLGDRVQLDLRPARALPCVLADQVQIEQVILNLVMNARDALGVGGRVTIETRTEATAGQSGLQDGPHVVLSIADNGPGISLEAMPHIFEPFFTTRNTKNNAGLGLSTCYGAVQQLGGAIQVTSSDEHDTVFEVWVPAISASKPEEPVAAQPAATRGDAEHILLVEDDEWVQKVTAGHIEALGYRVSCCSRGAEALRRFGDSDAFVLLISDVMMPELDGPSLAKLLRQRRPDLPVLFVSGHPLQDAVATSQHLLAKPYTRAQLASAIRKALDEPVT